MALLLAKVCTDDNTNNLLQYTANMYRKHSGTAPGGGEMHTHIHTYTHMIAPTSRERPKKNQKRPKQIL